MLLCVLEIAHHNLQYSTTFNSTSQTIQSQFKKLHNHSNFVYTHIRISKYVHVRIMSTSGMNYVFINAVYIHSFEPVVIKFIVYLHVYIIGSGRPMTENANRTLYSYLWNFRLCTQLQVYIYIQILRCLTIPINMLLCGTAKHAIGFTCMRLIVPRIN